MTYSRIVFGVALLLASIISPAHAADIQMLPPKPIGGTTVCTGGNQTLVYTGDSTSGHSGINCVPVTIDNGGNVSVGGDLSIQGTNVTDTVVNLTRLGGCAAGEVLSKTTANDFTCVNIGSIVPVCTGRSSALQFDGTIFSCVSIGASGTRDYCIYDGNENGPGDIWKTDLINTWNTNKIAPPWSTSVSSAAYAASYIDAARSDMNRDGGIVTVFPSLGRDELSWSHVRSPTAMVFKGVKHAKSHFALENYTVVSQYITCINPETNSFTVETVMSGPP